MSTVPGQDAKDKGNAAFKAGDFPAAIGHYTAAVIADPKNPTYNLNRAAAYLRLGKHEDAERDCDATVKLDSKNVKAWFRRGQARSGQEKFAEAKEDFKRTLQLDPSNEPAKQELAKVEGLLQYRAVNALKKRVPIDLSASTPKSSGQQSSATAAATAPKRRRVPIKIVDASDPGPSTSSTTPSSPISATASPSSASDDLMKPVSTRVLSSSTSSSTAPTPAKSTSFKDLKQARDTNKPSPSAAPPASDSPPPAPNPPRVKAGGGIFRSNGQHTVFGSGSQRPSVPESEPSAAPDPASQPTAAPVAKQPASKNTPLSLFNFVRAWDALSSPQARWTFLVESVHPTSLPSLFKTSLETPLLVTMLETFKEVLDNAPEVEVEESVKTYLLNMARVPRFTTIVLFMSKTERQLVKEVWDSVNVGDDQVERGARKVWGVS